MSFIDEILPKLTRAERLIREVNADHRSSEAERRLTNALEALVIEIRLRFEARDDRP